MEQSVSKTFSDSVKPVESNPKHGSRRGLGCMVGGTSMWAIGAVIYVLTDNPIWLVILAFFGIISGFLLAPLFVPKE